MHKIVVLFMAVSTIVATTKSFAASRYDGLWSVSIITESGDCAASYRYPMLIANGVLANGGTLEIMVRGRVAPSGAVNVVVNQGNNYAAGHGRLSSTVGRGSWRGASCSGSWTAESRSCSNLGCSF